MAEFDQQRLDRIKPWMQRYIDDRKLPGASLLIAKNGGEVFFHATGRRDLASDLPFERDTVARIYSMTKPVTSVGLMMLVEEGLCHLDAPVSTFLPEFADCKALVPGASDIDQTEPCPSPTLQQLLTHTSGLSYAFNPGLLPEAMEAQDVNFKPDGPSLQDTTLRLAELPLAFQPGARWEYSVGIDVIGRVIEAVADQPLSTFFAKRILGPLDMTETAFSVPEEAVDRFAALYTPLAGDPMQLDQGTGQGGDGLREVDRSKGSPFLDAKLYSGGGGLLGTIDDYLKFTEMMRQGGVYEKGRLLSPYTIDFMMQNHLAGDIASMGPQSFAEQPMKGMGFGIGGAVVLDAARAATPGSPGDFSWGGMASTFFWIDRVHNLSVVFFTQLAPSSSYPLRSQLKALVHGALT